MEQWKKNKKTTVKGRGFVGKEGGEEADKMKEFEEVKKAEQ